MTVYRCDGGTDVIMDSGETGTLNPRDIFQEAGGSSVLRGLHQKPGNSPDELRPAERCIWGQERLRFRGKSLPCTLNKKQKKGRHPLFINICESSPKHINTYCVSAPLCCSPFAV